MATPVPETFRWSSINPDHFISSRGVDPPVNVVTARPKFELAAPRDNAGCKRGCRKEGYRASLGSCLNLHRSGPPGTHSAQRPATSGIAPGRIFPMAFPRRPWEAVPRPRPGFPASGNCTQQRALFIGFPRNGTRKQLPRSRKVSLRDSGPPSPPIGMRRGVEQRATRGGLPWLREHVPRQAARVPGAFLSERWGLHPASLKKKEVKSVDPARAGLLTQASNTFATTARDFEMPIS